MRIKNLRRVSEVRFKKLDTFTLETSKNHLIRNFLRNGRVRIKWSKPKEYVFMIFRIIPKIIFQSQLRGRLLRNDRSFLCDEKIIW